MTLDFAFAVDTFSHMNELNVKPQGKDQFVHEMYTNVRALKYKLTLFSRQIKKQITYSFSHTRKGPLDMRRNTANHWTTYTENSAVGSLILKKS